MKNRHQKDKEREAFYAYLREPVERAEKEMERMKNEVEMTDELQACLKELDARMYATIEAFEETEAALREKDQRQFERARRWKYRAPRLVGRVALVAGCFVVGAVAVPTMRGVATYLKDTGSMYLKVGDDTIDLSEDRTEEPVSGVENREEKDMFSVYETDYPVAGKAEDIAWSYFEENVAPFRLVFDDEGIDVLLFQEANVSGSKRATFRYRIKGSVVKMQFMHEDEVKAVTNGMDEESDRRKVSQETVLGETVDIYRMDSENRQGYWTVVPCENLYMVVYGEMEKEDFIEFVGYMKIS